MRIARRLFLCPNEVLDMCMLNRSELVEKIIAAKAELKKAGPIHRRDLTKHIRRMERELRDYDRFQAAARNLAAVQE